MKKNKTMRFAALLLVLTLLSTCAISGTFAKYVTSGSGTDSARVAKWGVTVTANSDAFQATYAKDDSSVTDEGITNTVAAQQDVVAPGTKGSLAAVSISGTPEVAVKVTYDATVTLTGWSIPAGESTTEYCPIVFKVGNNEIKMNETITSVSALATAVETAIENYSHNYAANTNLSEQTNTAPAVSWEWPFEQESTDAYDPKDTAPGNLETAPTINLQVTTTVTQID